jgi:AraC family transcriptional regulator
MGKVSSVSVIEVKPQTVLGIRRQGRYREIRPLIRKVMEYGQANGAIFNGPPFYLSHETTQEESMKADREGTADLEVAVPVAGEVEGTDEITCNRIEGGKMAMVAHKGPHRECGMAFVKLEEWLEENGKTVSGPMREVYLNDPSEVGQEELMTEIYAPIG